MVSPWISLFLVAQVPINQLPPSRLSKDYFTLTRFESLLKQVPRPERRLTEEEAKTYHDPRRRVLTAVSPPWSLSELQKLSTMPTEALSKAVSEKPLNSPWETYELFVRAEPSAVRALIRSAEAGNANAVIAIARTLESKANSTLARLAAGPNSESKAVAGVLLGMQKDRRGFDGMRLAAAEYRHRLDRFTTTQLIDWGDANDLKQLRIYYGSRIGAPAVSLLRQRGKKACLDMLFELAEKGFRYGETIHEISLVRDKRTRGAMRKALFRGSANVREEAANWFALLGNASDVPTLKKCLGTPAESRFSSPQEQERWQVAVKRAIARLTPPKRAASGGSGR